MCWLGLETAPIESDHFHTSGEFLLFDAASTSRFHPESFGNFATNFWHHGNKSGEPLSRLVTSRGYLRDKLLMVGSGKPRHFNHCWYYIYIPIYIYTLIVPCLSFSKLTLTDVIILDNHWCFMTCYVAWCSQPQLPQTNFFARWGGTKPKREGDRFIADSLHTSTFITHTICKTAGF